MKDPDFTSQPLVGTLVIHGVGLIGGSLGLAGRRRGLVGEVIGVGRDASRLETAMRLGAIDRYVISHDDRSLAAACATADLVILCTPVSNIVHDLPVVLGAVGASARVTDVGSVKQVIVDASEGDPRFVGSHPMAGSELAGVRAARAELFVEATWALTPTKSTDPAALSLVRAFAQGVGATTRVLPATLHDQAVALTSHLPHLLAYALTSLAAETSEQIPDLPRLAAGSWESSTRVAASLPALWTDITAANQESLSQTLSAYRKRLDKMQAAIDSGDWDTLAKLLQDGYEAKVGWPGR